MLNPTDGDIVRECWPEDHERTVPLYLGTGRCGGCFNAWGLHHPEPPTINPRVGRTALYHRDLFAQGQWGQDHLVPCLRMLWRQDPPAPAAYRQSLTLREGRLRTVASGPGYRWECVVRTAPADGWRDMIEWEIKWRGALPDIVLQPVAKAQSVYGDQFNAHLRVLEHSSSAWQARWRAGSADGFLQVTLELASGRASLSTTPAAAVLRFGRKQGHLRLRLVLGAWARRDELLRVASSPVTFSRISPAAWRRRWRNIPKITSPVDDPNIVALASRSVSYLLSSFEPSAVCPPPPNGFSGNLWGFHFPQDTSFVHPALLALGQKDLARGVVEFYASRLEQMEEFTRRIWGVPGTFWAWEFPAGAHRQLLVDGAPNVFQFELHNAAYPARMAWDTACATPEDPVWARQIAWPIILGSARFYAALLRRQRNGEWGLRVKPSMGQDEYGGPDAPNYLCALQAAAYTLRTALAAMRQLKLRVADAAQWRRVLRDGLAFSRLLDRHAGLYATREGIPFRPHAQKHPVQLGSVTFLTEPQRKPDPATREALRLRALLASSHRDGFGHPTVRGSYYDGWTLAALWLADAHAGDHARLRSRLKEAPTAQLVDQDWVQLYESSGFWHPYYLTSHGLLLQSLMRSASGSPRRKRSAGEVPHGLRDHLAS